MRALVLTALAAGSFPTKHLATGGDGGSDAPQGGSDAPRDGTSDAPRGFECLGQPLPMTAPMTITFSGTIVDSSTVQPLTNLPFQLQDPLGNTLHNGATDNNGGYTFTQASNGVPIDAHFHTVGDPTHTATIQYPAYPYTANNTGIQLNVFSFSALQPLATGCGTTYDNVKPVLIVGVEDCNGTPLSGATVARPQSGTAVCYAGPAGATTTDTSGIALVFGLSPATVTANATTMENIALYSRDVKVENQSVTFVELRPGP